MTRLARTFSAARWGEYRRLLQSAGDAGYSIVSLEGWVRDPGPETATLVLRHDVDQHPASALTMAGIELELGLRSTWYLRWRTAHPEVVRRLREAGFEIGFHYETLSRLGLERGVRSPDQLVDEARRVLRAEVAAFQELHGPIRSIAPHGDSRIPQARNADLLRGEDPASYGVEFDGNESMRGRSLAYWLTDRSAPEGGWKDGVEPQALFDARVSPILCLTHPNNWTSGASLWLDRLLSTGLPRAGRGAWPIRTGVDAPRI